MVNCIGAIKPTISDDNKSISNAIKTNSLFPLDITNVSLKKGITYFKNRKFNLILDYVDFWNTLNYQDAIDITASIISLFSNSHLFLS